MKIGEELRVVTWLVGSTGELLELHLLCTPRFVVTVWTGDPHLLDDVRDRFARRAAGLRSHYEAAGILLQLLLSTLDESITGLDSRLNEAQLLPAKPAGVADSSLAGGRLRLESVWATFDRYASIVRSAVTGIEALPDMDQRGAAELNDYADLVADVEHRLHERMLWVTNILREREAGIAQHQSDQINRLTLVSVIFLPITFVTGFFGMNFNWMIANIGDRRAFLALGVALPVIIVALTVVLFRRRRPVGSRWTVISVKNDWKRISLSSGKNYLNGRLSSPRLFANSPGNPMPWNLHCPRGLRVTVRGPLQALSGRLISV